MYRIFETNRRAMLPLLKSVLVGLMVLAGLASHASAAEHVMIEIVPKNSLVEGKSAPAGPWNAANNGIARHLYSVATVESGFIEDLEKAQFLSFARGTSNENLIILANPDYQNAIKSFLSRGGTLLFQFQGGPEWWRNKKIEKFFHDINLGAPGETSLAGKYVGVEPSSLNIDLLNKPNNSQVLAKEFSGTSNAYMYYTQWSDQQQVLYHERGNPKHATMLVQQNVLGKGTVLMTTIFRLTDKNPPRHLIENILLHVFGELEQGAALKDAATSDSQSIEQAQVNDGHQNPLYLRGLVGKPWLHTQWDQRLPIVVHESAGLRRSNGLVNFVHDFPAGTMQESIQVMTPWGESLPTQANRVQDTTRYEIAFTTDVLPNDYVPLFVYFSGQSTGDRPLATPIRMEQRDPWIILSNDHLKVTLRNDKPVLVGLQPPGADSGNQFYDGVGLESEGWGLRYLNQSQMKWAVSVNQGPVQTTVRYEPAEGSTGPVITYALTHGSRFLSYEITSTKKQVLQRAIGYLPGQGLSEAEADRVYFAGKDQILTLQIVSGSWGSVTKNLPASEGWYAIEDTETSNVVGEIFDLTSRNNIRVDNTGERGYWVRDFLHLTADAPIRGAFIASEGGSYSRVRAGYLRFKNPLLLQIGTVQNKTDVAMKPTVSVFGKNLIMTPYISYWPAPAGGRVLNGVETYPEEPWKTIPDLLRGLQRMGSNYVQIWAYQPFWPSEYAEKPRTEFLEHLVTNAHQEGMGVSIGTPVVDRKVFYGGKAPDDWNADAIQFRDYFVNIAREIGKTRADMYFMRDEDTYLLNSEKAEKIFKSQYGMDPVKRVNADQLADPAHHNTALFNMDTYTDTLRAMASAVRENNSDMILMDQMNVAAMTHIASGAPHDIDKHAEFLNSIAMDLYGKPSELYKFYVKYIRGAFNNDSPIALYTGLTTNNEDLWLNQNSHLMWGADALFPFPPASVYTDFFEGLRTQFSYLDYTGLGDMLASYHPVRHIALLNDRDGLVDSIRQGEWGNLGSKYIERISNLTILTNLQSDILFSKDFNETTLQRYHMLVVSDNPAISPELTETMKNYVQAGGMVLVEGRAIHQPAMQQLVGVTPRGKSQTLQAKVMVEEPFDFYGRLIPVKADDATVRYQTQNGEPVLLEKKLGKGTIFYMPMVVSDQVLYNKSAGDWFKKFVNTAAGNKDMAVTSAGNSIDTNLFTDGKNHILAVSNSGMMPGDLNFQWLNQAEPAVLMAFSNGKQSAIQPSNVITVPGNSIQFFYIGDAKTVSLPRYVKTDTSGPGYSTAAGSEIMSLKAPRATSDQTLPSKARKGNDIFVGVISDKGQESPSYKAIVWGDEAIYETLNKARGITAELTSDLDAKSLARFDVVIVPRVGHQKQPPALKAGWARDLQEYAKQGGSVLLLHHAIGGGPGQSAVFPSVGSPATFVEHQIIKIVSDHSVASAESLKLDFPKLAAAVEFVNLLEETVLKKDMTFVATFPDYIPVRPGVDGEIIARGAEGAQPPVIVAGDYGKGRVVLCGTAIGAKVGADKSQEEIVGHGERSILLNAIHWLAANREKQSADAESQN